MTHQTKNGRAYYYHQIKSPNEQSWKKTYIRKKNLCFAEQLAQKEYFQTIKKELSEQIRMLENFKQNYDETALERIYSDLSEERKVLVEPIAVGVKEKLKSWNEESYEPNNAYPEHRIYETERGEKVRSKSEVIIANLLYKHRQDLDYKYERPLKLSTKDKKEIVVHPDFTIINKHTGKIYYYEHAGKIEDSRYAIDFVRRVELYATNNILQGRDLLITYEAVGAPLCIQCVRKIVENILE